MTEQRQATSGDVRGYWLRFAATFIICGWLSWLAYRLPSGTLYVKLIWIPAGVALAAVLRWGYGMLPAIALAELAPTLHMLRLDGAIIGVTGAVVEAALAAWLLRRVDFHPEFDRVRDALWFTLVAVIVCPALSGGVVAALLGFVGLCARADFWSNCYLWWAGDAAGILILSPLLMTLGSPRNWRYLGRHWREFVLLTGCWGLVDLWIYRLPGLPANVRYPLDYLFDPLLIWAALRFGPMGIAVMGPIALLQDWWLQPTGFSAGPSVALLMPTPYPMVNIAIVWLTALMLASVVWELRDAETEFQHSSRTLSSLIDTSPLAILAVDLQDRILQWNRAAERLFGRRRQEVIGNPLPFHDAGELSGYMRALRQSPPLHGVDVQWHDSGKNEVLSLRLYSSPLEDHEGSIHGTMALISDVTAQRTLEQRLQQSQKLEAVGRLAGGIAQDFNHLLGVILDQSNLILDETLVPTVRKRIGEMRSMAERASALTRQLMAFSRRQFIEPEIIDLNEVIRTAWPLLERLTGDAVQFESRLAPDLGRMKIDQAQLEQILLNLVVNARDAMPAGGRLEVATLNAGGPADLPSDLDETPEDYVSLVVTDSGCGMTPAVQARIFEPFFTTKAIGRGAGLGLATVYGIIQQNRGQIRLWSEPEVGTRFEILFPRWQCPEVDAE